MNLRDKENENRQDLKEMIDLVGWDKQKNLYEQAQYLRKRYDELVEYIENTPGEFSRGTLLLACNVLMSAAEELEARYAEQLGERRG